MISQPPSRRPRLSRCHRHHPAACEARRHHRPEARLPSGL